MERSKRSLIISIGIIIALGFTIYANSINGQFVWDDNSFIKDNQYIKSAGNIPDIFSTNIGKGVGKVYSLYRPLQMLTYMVDYSLWGLDVKGYHITNIVLHILAALALFYLTFILFGNRSISFFAAALFMVHPVHTGAVASISGRADPMAALLLLLAMISYVKGRIFWTITAYALALLTRENALVLPLLILAYHYSLKAELKAGRFLPVLGVTVLYIAFRATVLSSLLPHTSAGTTALQRLPGFFAAMGGYVRLLLAPIGLHMIYGKRLFGWTDPAVIAGALLFTALIVSIVRSKGRPIAFFSLSWFAITLLPQSNLYPINAYMAEHWLYLPSMGAALLAASAISSLRTPRPAAIFVILLTAFSFLTIKQNLYWKTAEGFYKKTLEYVPDSAWIYNNLGNVYYYSGREEEALECYEKALSVDSSFQNTYYNLANIYHGFGKAERAVQLLEKAVSLNPEYAHAYNNLGVAYYDLKRYDKAKAAYRRAISLKPDFADAHFNLGNFYYYSDRAEEAVTSYNKAIGIEPRHSEAHKNLSLIYGSTGKNGLAIKHLNILLDIDPEDGVARTNLAIASNGLGVEKARSEDMPGAIEMFKKAIREKKDYASAHINLSRAYFNTGEFDLAVDHCDRAIELGYEVDSGFIEDLKPYRAGQDAAE
jgi:tetratricopeptide (TPR) repeat protein